MADDATPGAEAAEAGIPQIDFATFPNQIFWLAVALIAIYLILTRVAMPRIAAVLAERQGTLTNDLAAAEDLKRQAVEAEEAYKKALADARAEAQKIAEEPRASIQAELNDAIAKADAEISAKTAESETRIAEIQASAAESVAQVAADVAGDIAGAVVPGKTIDANALSAAVAERAKG